MNNTAKLELMHQKMYVFHVADESAEKPTIWCQMTDKRAVDDQEIAEKLIRDYVIEHLDGVVVIDDWDIEDLAYTMRKIGAARLEKRFCFELTEVNS